MTPPFDSVTRYSGPTYTENLTGSSAPDCNEQTGASCVADKWNVYQGQCTSWVAYRLNHLNFKAEKDFHNHYKVHWVDASNWGAAARSVDIAVDDSPRKGDVAWWNAAFRVAYVEEVYADGSILISEMNQDYHNAFRMTTFRRGGRWSNDFIHIKDVQGAQWALMDMVCRILPTGVQI